jgi:hypothetical protein
MDRTGLGPGDLQLEPRRRPMAWTLPLDANPCRLSPGSAFMEPPNRAESQRSAESSRGGVDHNGLPWKLDDDGGQICLLLDLIEPVFDNAKVHASDADDHLLSQIANVCRWYAISGPPTAQRQAAALAELAQITAGRTVARHTGPDASAYERATQLCITAGADMSLIAYWSRESRHRHATRTNRRPQP